MTRYHNYTFDTEADEGHEVQFLEYNVVHEERYKEVGAIIILDDTRMDHKQKVIRLVYMMCLSSNYGLTSGLEKRNQLRVVHFFHNE